MLKQSFNSFLSFTLCLGVLERIGGDYYGITKEESEQEGRIVTHIEWEMSKKIWVWFEKKLEKKMIGRLFI